MTDIDGKAYCPELRQGVDGNLVHAPMTRRYRVYCAEVEDRRFALVVARCDACGEIRVGCDNDVALGTIKAAVPDLPADARVTGVTMDWWRRGVMFRVESLGYPVQDCGVMPPIHCIREDGTVEVLP